jgi:hypothetical protein
MKKMTGMSGESGESGESRRGRNRRSVNRSLGPSLIMRGRWSLAWDADGHGCSLERAVFIGQAVIKDPHMAQEVKDEEIRRAHSLATS